MKYLWVGLRVGFVSVILGAAFVAGWIYGGEYEADYQYVQENRDMYANYYER